MALAMSQALWFPGAADAVGLGELVISSRLFQPLDARIEVYGVDQFEADNLRVKIADTAAFVRARLDRHPVLNGVRVSVERDAEGVVYLRLESDRALREPLLAMLIETEWPGGRLLREYTLMLDPPAAPITTAAAPAPAPAAARVRPAAASTSSLPAADARAAPAGPRRENAVRPTGCAVSATRARYRRSYVPVIAVEIVYFEVNPWLNAARARFNRCRRSAFLRCGWRTGTGPPRKPSWCCASRTP